MKSRIFARRRHHEQLIQVVTARMSSCSTFVAGQKCFYATKDFLLNAFSSSSFRRIKVSTQWTPRSTFSSWFSGPPTDSVSRILLRQMVIGDNIFRECSCVEHSSLDQLMASLLSSTWTLVLQHGPLSYLMDHISMWTCLIDYISDTTTNAMYEKATSWCKVDPRAYNSYVVQSAYNAEQHLLSLGKAQWNAWLSCSMIAKAQVLCETARGLRL